VLAGVVSDIFAVCELPILGGSWIVSHHTLVRSLADVPLDGEDSWTGVYANVSLAEALGSSLL